MDQYFVRYLLLDETIMIAIAIALLVIGGIAASFIFKVRMRLRRATYSVLNAMAVLALAGAQFGWLLASAAATYGVLWVLTLGLVALPLLHGAVVYYFAAARSNDISGNTRQAWLAFVPILNLGLVFKRGNAPDGPAKPRHWVSRFVADPVLILAALTALSLSRASEKLLTTAFEGYSRSQTLVELLNKAQTVEEYFAAIADAMQSLLPQESYDNFTLTSVKAEGNTLHYSYLVDGPVPTIIDDAKQGMAADFCSNPDFKTSLAQGGHLLFTYGGADGEIFGEIDVSQSDCGGAADI